MSFIHFGNNACQFFLHLTGRDPLLDKDEDGVVAGHGAQNGAATAAVDVARQTDGIALTGLDDPHITQGVRIVNRFFLIFSIFLSFFAGYFGMDHDKK